MIESIFHGHSFVEINDGEHTIFIDPFITGNSQCDCTVTEAIAKNPTIIIVTHGHSDHIGDSIEIAKQTGCMIVATFELTTRFKEQGIEHCSPQNIGGSTDYDRCSIKFTPALHGGQIEGSPITTVAAGVLVNIGNHRIHHAGDTGLTKEFELLGDGEPIAISFLPIGDRFTMGPKDALRAIPMIEAKYIVPIHFNTWENIKADTDTFAREVMQQGVSIPKILKAGQMIVLD